MEKKDRIDRLRKELYSRGNTPQEEGRHTLRPAEERTSRTWKSNPHAQKVMPQKIKKKHSFLGIFFVFALIFFIGSTLFGAFYFFGEKNVVSADNVDIQVQGPTSIGGGERLELQLSIINKNSTTLELADLLVEYPEGTRAPDNTQRELLRHRESIGNIAPGERVKKNVSAVLFGEENTQKDIKVIVEYRVSGSNAIFFSEKVYNITLSSAPISVSVRSLDEVTSGQVMDFDIVVRSNSTTVVEDVVFKVEYPFGFVFTEASPSPKFSDSIWALGDLAPEEEKRIRISGTMTGQDNEERVFRFSGGIGDQLDVKKLATTFVATTRSVTIQRPFISSELSLNGELSDAYVFSNEERIVGDIVWKNNLDVPVFDAQIELRLSGSVIDEGRIVVEKGFYNSVTDTARWGKDTTSTFERLDPSEAGSVRFSFDTKNITAAALKNPEITFAITVRGRREGDNGVPENIESVVTRTARISSDLSLTSQLRRNTGPFTNTGPLPPKAESETFYTVTWRITNVANHVSGTEVTAILPSYVRWTGNTTQNSDIRFNQNNRQITWDVGEVPQGVGTNVSPKEISFQIGLTPSLSQVGEAPALVHTQVVRGFDQFVEQQIERSTSQLDTKIQFETGIPSGHGIIVQ